MRLTYDPRYNIADIRLQEKGPEVESIRLRALHETLESKGGECDSIEV